jgi:hypothetical protein
MNFTPLEDAYKIHHTTSNTYSQQMKYSSQCPFCPCKESTPLMQSQDRGSFRRCNNCRKNFHATILGEPVPNYINSTQHLKGTN